MTKYFLIISIVLLASCRSSRTNKVITKTVVDSASTSKVDTGSVKKTNEVSVVTKDEDKTTVTTVEFDTSGNDLGDDFQGTNPVKKEDYVTIDSSGNIKIKGKIKKVKVENHGISSSKDSNATASIDSNYIKKDETIHVEKEEVKKVIDKKKGNGFLGTIGLIVLLGGLVYIILWLRKKKLI